MKLKEFEPIVNDAIEKMYDDLSLPRDLPPDELVRELNVALKEALQERGFQI